MRFKTFFMVWLGILVVPRLILFYVFLCFEGCAYHASNLFPSLAAAFLVLWQLTFIWLVILLVAYYFFRKYGRKNKEIENYDRR